MPKVIGSATGAKIAETFEGGCLCGNVRYRALGKPLASNICHCRSCRLASGAPSVAWVTWTLDNFAWIAGAPARFASSPDVERTFCGRCGSPLTYQKIGGVNDGLPDSLDVTTATLDTPDAFPPTLETWAEHKLAWSCVNGQLPLYERSSVSETTTQSP